MIDKSVIRYMACKPEDMTGKYSFNLMPDNDTLAIAELNNSEVVYPRLEFGQEDPDLRILAVVIGKSLEEEFAYQVDIENPMDDENEMETVFCLDIAMKTFRSPETVKIAYPQTAGTFDVTTIDEDGNEVTITHDKMKAYTWAL